MLELWEKSWCWRRVNHLFQLSKGPDSLDWQNLFGPTKNLDKICFCQIFNLSSVGVLKHSKILVNHMCQSHETRASIATFEEFSDLPNIAGAIDGTHIKIKAPKESAFDYFSRYKLNSTWPWRCSWNVNLGTIIVVFWVRIVMQHAEVRIFHLHRLIAA